MSVTELERAAGISRSMAGNYRRIFLGEARAQADAAAANANAGDASVSAGQLAK